MKANVLSFEHERDEELLHNPRRQLQRVIDHHREDKFLARLVHEVTRIGSHPGQPTRLHPDPSLHRRPFSKSTYRSRSPAFWVLTIGIGIYYFAFLGITLISESLVVSLDFSTDIRNWFLAIMMFSGLARNLCCGWLAQRISGRNIFGGAMIIFAACLIGFPLASGSIGLIYAVAVALGIGSGAVTVIFFAGLADLFGKRHLGRIQGVAQAMTLTSSGTGPLFFARNFESSGSYSSVFFTLAPLALLIGIWALRHRRADTFAGK